MVNKVRRIEDGDCPTPKFLDYGGLMSGRVKLIDSTLVIMLNNGEQEVARALASQADALRVGLMMLARRGRLDSGAVPN